MNDTICAISTALGVGAISIIKISGSDAINIVSKIFSNKKIKNCESHTIHYGFIMEKKEKIDEVLVSIMKAPKTFTKEDVIEINCHGGIATTNKVLELLLNNGCRLAEGGEFTKRAFLNGRISLLEAEGIEDLIYSKTDKARKMAMTSVTGKLSKVIESCRNSILKLRANIEVNIDYPEYEDEVIVTKKLLKEELNKILNQLNKILKESENGKLIKEGLNVVLVGKPNVGKSSILNHLLNEDKAIVTDIAGTTRDIIEGSIIIEGIKLNIFDTAGIRKTKNKIEQIGVNKSLKEIESADLVIFVLSNTEKVSKEELEILNQIKEKRHIILINKNDLHKESDVENYIKDNLIYASTKAENGLNDLKKKIISMFKLDKFEKADFTYLSNSRQIALVKSAITNIEEAIKHNEDDIPIDLIAIDIENSWNLLGEIIGEVFKDELLDEIFSNFCLGK